MQIFNTLGDAVKQANGSLNGQLIQTDVSKFAGGLYILKLTTEPALSIQNLL